ncbi:TIGR04222 domain-containing membrane protein [Streptomyces sp. NPDC015139]|uniref:TIGR04222 domain-containing membrane protein n=1 Tax=Streptomyces sp. NPDC015139 TaxID=3364942 RepID=UPI0036FBDEBD
MPVERIGFVVLAVTAALLVSGALCSGRAARRVAAVAVVRRAEPVADVYEIAYLRGGTRRLFEVVAVRMRDTRRLTVSGRHDWIRLDPAALRPQDDVEAAFADAVVRHRATARDHGLPWQAPDDERVDRLVQRLVGEGLLNDPVRAGAALTAFEYLVLAISVSWLLTVAGVVLAWLDGSYGILAGYVPVLVVPWILWWRDSSRHPGPSPLGRRAVGRAKKGAWAPDPHPGPDRGDPEVLGRVALHGRHALPDSHPLAPPPPPPESEYVPHDAPGLGGL